MTTQHFGERLHGGRQGKSGRMWWWGLILTTTCSRLRSGMRILWSSYESEAQMKVACYREFLEGHLRRRGGRRVAVKIQLAYFEALGRGRLPAVRRPGRPGQGARAVGDSRRQARRHRQYGGGVREGASRSRQTPTR